MPGGASQPRKTLDAWQDWAKQRGAHGPRVRARGRGRHARRARRQEPVRDRAGGPGRGRGRRQRRLHLLRRRRGGRVARPAGRRAQRDRPAASASSTSRASSSCGSSTRRCSSPSRPDDDDVALGSSAWTAVHHAFTSPKPEWIDRFEEDPGNALAYAYDIVCNGNEIGGGSIRIHRRDVQERVFQIMGIGEEEAQEKFGFLLDAFQFGAPPHGGIALGWDRVVMLLGGYDSIRDVIAFPKSGGGYDPLTSAPAPDPRASSARRRAWTSCPRQGRQGLVRTRCQPQWPVGRAATRERSSRTRGGGPAPGRRARGQRPARRAPGPGSRRRPAARRRGRRAPPRLAKPSS